MRRFSRVGLGGTIMVLCVVATATWAADIGPSEVVAALARKYPAGSIQDVQQANQALGEVNQGRATIEARFGADKRACYEKFFSTTCLDAAKEQRRKDLTAIKAVEVEANYYLRKERAADRDKAVSERQLEAQRRATEAAQTPPRAQAGDAAVAQSASPPATPAQASANAGGVQDSASSVAEQNAGKRFRGKMSGKPAPKTSESPSADATEEAKARFEQKQQDIKARQDEVARKKSDKALKASDKAAKDAQTQGTGTPQQ